MEEIKQAAWDYDNLYNLGLNGLNYGFLKEFWEMVKKYFCKLVEDFHDNERLMYKLNNTFIALIPKETSPKSLSDSRLIFLVSCVKSYKNAWQID